MAQARLLSRLVHDRTGAGEPVVLIHGIGHRRQTWDPVTDLLAQRYEVVRPDLAANFAEWGLERPHVVGNSLGGAISLELAARGLVSSATVLSPAGFFGRFDRAWALLTLSLLRLGATLPDAVLRANAHSALGRKVSGALLYSHPERATAEGTYGDSLALKRASAFFPTIRAGLRYSCEPGDIEVPVTVAWGTGDRLLPYRQSREARRRLPQAQHLALPGCGHIPMIDDPELVVSTVEATISRATASEAA